MKLKYLITATLFVFVSLGFIRPKENLLTRPPSWWTTNCYGYKVDLKTIDTLKLALEDHPCSEGVHPIYFVFAKDSFRAYIPSSSDTLFDTDAVTSTRQWRFIYGNSEEKVGTYSFDESKSVVRLQLESGPEMNYAIITKDSESVWLVRKR